ncbi:hypothetical protein XELAEV_18025145mg [Xenopus laevis]|uniref:Uncharacterized protein n=1 Tax=Xenopus laevis TaxID=8355 RepID=A0A974D1N0_XENLA|nr:hypothetical protein XELAEV_18025145mg [Xenopus laevis]
MKLVQKGDIVQFTSPVTLTEGDRVTLVTDVLMATDGTGKLEKLLYAVSVPPVHGQIENINYPSVPISSFRQLDVAAQKVCYVHDNSHETTAMLASSVVTTLVLGAIFQRQVQAIVKWHHTHNHKYCTHRGKFTKGRQTLAKIRQRDVISVVCGFTNRLALLRQAKFRSDERALLCKFFKMRILLNVTCSARLAFASSDQDTARNLKATDSDSKDEDLKGVDLWGLHLLREINQRAIHYIINPSAEVNSDSFEFKIFDPAGNEILSETYPHYHTCENFGTFGVKFIQNGSSKGVSTKHWNIHVKNDGLEENHEFLKIILKAPKNAVHGKIYEATIEIIHLRGVNFHI